MNHALSGYPILLCQIMTHLIEQNKKKDQKIQEIMEQIMEGLSTTYHICQNIVYTQKEGRDLIVVPSEMATKIIKELHEQNCHFGKEH